MKKIPWFKFNPIDFMDDEAVKMMCDEAIGLYVRMLCHCWTHDSMPVGEENIMRLFKISKHKYKKLWPKIESCFFEEKKRFFNHRLSKEKHNTEKTFLKKSKTGTENANKRWELHNLGNAVAMQDPDPDKDPDKRTNNSPVPSSESKTGTGPNNSKSKISARAGYQISQAVNGHSNAFMTDITENAPIVRKLLNKLLSVREVASEPERLLGFILQARRAEGVVDRVAYCISIIKNSKHQVADGCLQDAKILMRSWTDGEIDQRVADIIPDMGVDNE